MKRRLFRVFVFLVLVLLTSASCGDIFPVKIGDIRGNPRKYVEKKVTVSGKVMEAISLIAIKYFVLKDDTGEITVVTSRPLPAVGQKLTVHGVVKEAFSLGDQNPLVIREDPD